MRSLLTCIFLLYFSPTIVVAAEATEKNANQAGPNRGLTLDEVGRGLKSAAQNIEKEIPKIGPAISATVNKVTGKERQKESFSGQPPKKK